jgi:hypothetical protein
MSSGAFPFLQGATNAAERMNKTHKLIYGTKRLGKLQKSVNNASSPREKPSVETLLLHAPSPKIPELIRAAHLAGEFSNFSKLNRILDQFKKFNRYDKALATCRAFEQETGKALQPGHFVTLMAMALKSSNLLEHGGGGGVGGASGWRESLRLFETGFIRRKDRNPLTSPAVGAAMMALNVGGRWADSVALFSQAIADRIPLDPKAVHGLVFHLRASSRRWDLALRAFDAAAKSGTVPDYELYRELFYAIHDSARSDRNNAATAWEFALSVATAIEHVCPMNAGIYNSLISTCAIRTKNVYSSNSSSNSNSKKLASHWEAGLRVLQHLQDRVVLSAVKDNSSRTIINTGTITALSSLRRNNPEHQIRCVDLARQHGLPVSDAVYFALLHSLDLARRSDEGLAFAQKLMDDAVNDPSNLGLSLSPLLTALTDSLALHPDPEVALLAATRRSSVVAASLRPVVSSATAGCAVWGDESQAWIVEAGTRVGVLSVDVLEMMHSGRVVDVLLSKFDAIMVPFTSVRVLVQKLEKEPNHSPRAAQMTKALHLLRRLQVLENPNKSGTGFAHVLPFIHHLKSLNYLNTCSPYYNEDKKVEEEEFNKKQQQQRQALLTENSETEKQNKVNMKKKLKETKFLSASVPNTKKITIEEEENESNSIITSTTKEKNVVQPPPWWNSSSSSRSFDPSLGFSAPTSKQWSHVAATSLMLSRLNPDAEITVVTRASYRDKEFDCCAFYGVRRVAYENLENSTPFRFTKENRERRKLKFERMQKRETERSSATDVVSATGKEPEEGKGAEKKQSSERSEDLVRSVTSPNMH